MDSKDRSFVIKLNSKTAIDGKVPLKLFVKALESIQKTTYDLAEARLNREPSSKGRKPAIIARECELFVEKAEPGSLTATLTFPPKTDMLTSCTPDIADNVKEDLQSVFIGISKRDSSLLKKVLPNPAFRKKIYSDLRPVLPSKKSDYEFYFSVKDNNDTELCRIERLAKEEEEEILRFSEEIISSEDKNNNDETIRIRATCNAKLNGKGDPEITEILNYELLDLRPYRVHHFIHGNEEFILRKEIACDVKEDDGYIVVEYEPLGIIAYAQTREDALEAFNEEFAMIFHEYGQEDIKNLTLDAIELKNKINSLVEGVQIIENSEN